MGGVVVRGLILVFGCVICWCFVWWVCGFVMVGGFGWLFVVVFGLVGVLVVLFVRVVCLCFGLVLLFVC